MCMADAFGGLDWLNADERAEANAIQSPMLRNEFVASRSLVRLALARLTGVQASSLRFARSSLGKPRVVEPRAARAACFSSSRAGGLVGCASTWGYDLGLDLELESRVDDPLDVARRHFAPEELALIERAPRDDAKALFVRLWALKEAYLKALGVGLTVPLNQIAFGPPRDVPFFSALRGAPHFLFLIKTLPEGHVLSLALPAALKGVPVTFERIDDTTVCPASN